MNRLAFYGLWILLLASNPAFADRVEDFKAALVQNTGYEYLTRHYSNPNGSGISLPSDIESVLLAEIANVSEPTSEAAILLLAKIIRSSQTNSHSERRAPEHWLRAVADRFNFSPNFTPAFDFVREFGWPRELALDGIVMRVGLPWRRGFSNTDFLEVLFSENIIGRLTNDHLKELIKAWIRNVFPAERGRDRHFVETLVRVFGRHPEMAARICSCILGAVDDLPVDDMYLGINHLFRLLFEGPWHGVDHRSFDRPFFERLAEIALHDQGESLFVWDHLFRNRAADSAHPIHEYLDRFLAEEDGHLIRHLVNEVRSKTSPWEYFIRRCGKPRKDSN